MLKTKREKIFCIINYLLLSAGAILMLLPLLHIVAKSFSNDTSIISGQVTFFPIGFNINTYKYVLLNSQFLNSFMISIFVTVVGTVISLLVTVMTAYPLSKPNLKGRKFLLLAFVFTMLFNGGIIPTYLLMKNLGMINTVWALIFPFTLTVFNILVVKSYFEGIPDSLEEAAKIDGASNIRILFSIFIPISKPVLATITLFYAVTYWNNYFNALIYISKPELKPLQLFLYELVTQSQKALGELNADQAMSLTPDSIRAAAIVASTLPIVLVYPFLQKHFVKGLTIGSIKG